MTGNGTGIAYNSVVMAHEGVSAVDAEAHGDNTEAVIHAARLQQYVLTQELMNGDLKDPEAMLRNVALNQAAVAAEDGARLKKRAEEFLKPADSLWDNMGKVFDAEILTNQLSIYSEKVGHDAKVIGDFVPLALAMKNSGPKR